MGAWDHGIFDDDSACDLSWNLRETEDPKDFFKTAFETATDAAFLEYDDGHAVTVSAAYMDHLLNGTPYEGEEENMADFKTKFPALLLNDLKPLAVSALQVVIGENSELNELWAENEELYPKWKQNIQALIDRLS